MQFDPNWPQNNMVADADKLRGQLTALKALTDAMPSVTSAQVDAVNTLDPGQRAAVSVSVGGGVLRLSFAIPRGNDGANGADGASGADGTTGADGANGTNGSDGTQGPPFAQAVVDAVNTLDPGEAASVEVSFDGSNVHFTFAIPRGSDGSNGNDGQPGGPPGPQGEPGQPGEQGAPGEVSQASLDAAIGSTSANTDGVATLDDAMSDPENEALRQKLNELIVGLRR